MAPTVEAEGLGQGQDPGQGQEKEIQGEAGLAHQETRIHQGNHIGQTHLDGIYQRL